MDTRKRLAVIAAACVLGVGGAVSVAAAGNDDGEGTVTGRDAERAEDAALRYTGGGHANAVERDSENGATWEVEVERADGSQVDVRLDAEFRLVVIESDSETD